MAACTQADHVALTANLDAFIAGTYHVGVQRRMHPDEPHLLMGNCPLCASTLCYPLHDAGARGYVAHGTICRPDPNDNDRRIT